MKDEALVDSEAGLCQKGIAILSQYNYHNTNELVFLEVRLVVYVC